jgi:hypothetical protein
VFQADFKSKREASKASKGLQEVLTSTGMTDGGTALVFFEVLGGL